MRGGSRKAGNARCSHWVLSQSRQLTPTGTAASRCSRFRPFAYTSSRVPGVRAEVLDPRAAYGDVLRYDEQARALAARFAENFAQYQR
jgi:hypothetical protein